MIIHKNVIPLCQSTMHCWCGQSLRYFYVLLDAAISANNFQLSLHLNKEPELNSKDSIALIKAVPSSKFCRFSSLGRELQNGGNRWHVIGSRKVKDHVQKSHHLSVSSHDNWISRSAWTPQSIERPTVNLSDCGTLTLLYNFISIIIISCFRD